LQVFDTLDAALSAMAAALTLEAGASARRAGAENLRFATSREIREACVEGKTMFIEASVSVTASGRPRVAHGAGAAESA